MHVDATSPLFNAPWRLAGPFDVVPTAAGVGHAPRGLSLAGFESHSQRHETERDHPEITGRDENGEWLYWLSIMGTPSSDEPWGWQLDGHHLIINCFVLQDHMV
jgi:hypothetical protein